ncbi:helix-turn-helix domain-containing protein [Kineosporia sp. R_H_3]|uniref:helix-turn-helix domain-containing protein n=1 Tax=Kineosporia sp. R_H_3 TaxID=1961848 RepID=UPI000B4AAD96|nr:helix-turn-helix domain-containing protein [Kineosporia sp. R_H_3]
MANERLRATLLQRGLTLEQLAEQVEVDAKTVERWIGGRVPYRRSRYAVAMALGVEETYLWPQALSDAQLADAAESEILTVYPHRWTVPRDIWGRLFGEAEEDIGILVYSGFFLADDPGMLAMFRQKAAAGVRVRILIGDPDSAEVLERSQAEGIDDALVGKIRNVISLFKPLRAQDGVEIRLHSTPLYNSMYWADDELLVNTHVYGAVASLAPVMHLRRIAGGDLVTTYLDSFEKVWADAKPLD